VERAGIRREDRGRLQVGLGLATVLGLGSTGLMLRDLLGAGFAPQTNAYAAIFYTVGGFHAVLTVAGLGINAFVLARAWRGHFDAQRFLAVQNAALYWYFLVASWFATAATLYLVPHLV